MSRATLPPLRLGIPAAVGLGLVLLPLAGLVAWSLTHGVGGLGSSGALTALAVSLETSLLATAVAAVLGLPLAAVYARWPLPGISIVRALTTLPMVLPPVVAGVALLAAFGRHGLAGPLLAQFGISLPFTTAGAALSQAFVAMPFLIVSAEAGMRGVDPRLEDAARSLGAHPSSVFWRVTLPLAMPSIVAGLVLCWARALGEFGATITFAGNLPGTTQTLPLAVYLALQSDPDAAVAMSLVLLVISATVLVLLRHQWLRTR